MSFGFSVGDFIEVADKAWMVYEKCKAAPGQYQRLASSVLILHQVLDDTKIHIQAEEPDLNFIPQSKKKALVAARYNCDATLDEIDALLLKSTSLGSNMTAKLMDRMRFITSDALALEQRLDTNRSYLSLCLESMNSLSLRHLARAYQDIVEGDRSGTKERSLFSEALSKDQKIDVDEAMRLAKSDLLDKDIHPDCIDLHKDEIQKWVVNTIAEEEEGNVVPPPSEDPSLSAFASRQPAEEENLYDRAPILAPELPAQRAENIDRLPRLFPPSETPSSRRPSDASHRSKDASWHPSNEPKPGYVNSMLVKGFQFDPLEKTYDIENAKLYFKRAFHQQDCHDCGYLDRYEVVSICRRAIKQVDPAADDSQIASFVHDGYQNQDGRVDEGEFVTIMLNVIQMLAEDVGARMQATFSNVSETAEKLAERRRRALPARALPWGFRRTGCPPFFDEVEEKEYDKPPELLPAWSFTSMANDVAGHCVQVLGPVRDQWSEVLPTKQDRESSRKTFEKVREAALNFTTFFNPLSEKFLSDLDEIMTVLAWLEHSGTQYSAPLQTYSRILHSARKQYYNLAQHIKGFVYRLEHRDPDDFTSTTPSEPLSTTNYPRERTKWEEAHMDQWAVLIEKLARDDLWKKPKEDIDTCRKWYRQAGEIQPKGIPFAKKFADQAQPLRSFSSHSQDAHVNALNSQAMKIARSLCQIHRREEDKRIENLLPKGRLCRLSHVDFARKSHKSKRLFVKSPKLHVRLYVDAMEPESSRSTRVWTAPGEDLRTGTIHGIKFTIPKTATRIKVVMHEPDNPASKRSRELSLAELEGGIQRRWANEYGTLAFFTSLSEDPAKHKRTASPWLQYVTHVWAADRDS